jgi:hypothetical protein
MLKQLINYFGYGFLALAIFGSGFYFGAKAQMAKNSKEQVAAAIEKEKSANDKGLGHTDAQNIAIKEVEGVYWIKLGMEPVCPSEYPVKGKFADTGGVYYTKESKTYSRIKPELCFAAEEFAREKAGFVKKF